MKINPKAIGVGVITAALAASLVACSNGTAQTAGESGTPHEGGTLVYADSAFINSWLPTAAGWYQNATILNNVLDRLVYLDPDTQQIEPWLADSVHVDPTATRFTFGIRNGVTFSDGTELTPAVVKANLDRLARGDAALGITASPYLKGVAETVVDGNSVVLTLSSPNRYVLTALSQANAGILSASTLQRRADEYAVPGNVVGTGPFVFDSQIEGQEVTLKRRDDYAWPYPGSANPGAAHLESVVVKTISEPALRTGAIQSNQVDAVKGIQPVDEAVLEGSGATVHALKSTLNTTDQLSLRPGNPILSDVRFRKALSVGVNRRELVDTVLSPSYPATTSLLIDGAANYASFDDELAYDKDEANELLDEAGWIRNQDGVRVKDGQTLTVPIAASSQSSAVKPAIDYLAQQWRSDLGVVVENHALDDTYFARGNTETAVASKLFRPALDGGIPGVFEGATNVATLWDDPEVDEIFARDRAAVDPAVQADTVKEEMHALLVDKVYSIPLYEPAQVVATRHGAHLDFNAYTSPNWQSSWIDE